MTATLTSDGSAVDLTAASVVKFIMTLRGSTTPKVNAPGAIDPTPTTGKVSYSWGATDTDTAGVYRAEWEIAWADGSKQTYPSDGFIWIEVLEDLA